MGYEDEEEGTTETENSDGGNPSWQELYGVLPDNLHSLVTPVLEKWESGTQAKFTEYAERDKSYEPYQQFIDGQVDPQQIEQALSVAQLIDSDPRAFMAQMQAFFGEDQQQQQPDDDEQRRSFDEQPFDISTDPKFQQISQQQEVIAGFLAKQIEDQRASEEDSQLDNALVAMTEKYGEFDQDYVFGLLLNGVDLEQAVTQYHTLVDNIRSRPAADHNLPNIVSPSGGMPSEYVDPAEMTDQQRKAYVMSVLQQANNNN